MIEIYAFSCRCLSWNTRWKPRPMPSLCRPAVISQNCRSCMLDRLSFQRWSRSFDFRRERASRWSPTWMRTSDRICEPTCRWSSRSFHTRRFANASIPQNKDPCNWFPNSKFRSTSVGWSRRCARRWRFRVTVPFFRFPLTTFRTGANNGISPVNWQSSSGIILRWKMCWRRCNDAVWRSPNCCRTRSTSLDRRESGRMN